MRVQNQTFLLNFYGSNNTTTTSPATTTGQPENDNENMVIACTIIPVVLCLIGTFAFVWWKRSQCTAPLNLR